MPWRIRRSFELGTPIYSSYDKDESQLWFSIKLYHGGHFNAEKTEYMGGKVDYVDFCNMDMMSYIELGDMAVEAGHSGYLEFFHRNPTLELPDALTILETDSDVMKLQDFIMAEYQNILEIYVEVVAEPLVVIPPDYMDHVYATSDEESEEVPEFASDEDEGFEHFNTSDECFNHSNDGTSTDRPVNDDEMVEEPKEFQTPIGSKFKNMFEETDIDKQRWEARIAELWSDSDVEQENVKKQKTNVGDKTRTVPVQRNGKGKCKDNVEWLAPSDEGSDEDSDDSDFDVRLDSGAGQDDEDDDDFEEYVDNDSGNRAVDPTANQNKRNTRGGIGNYFGDDDFDEEEIGADNMPNVNLDEDGAPVWPEFNEEVDMAAPQFEVGMIFSNNKVFKEAIKTYAVLIGRDITFKKNEWFRVRCVCVAPCPWTCFASVFDDNSRALQVKTYIGKHEGCTRTRTVKHVSVKWLTKMYLPDFKVNPDISSPVFQQMVLRRHEMDISRYMAQRVKKCALEKIKGTIAGQYAKLWDYVQELRFQNPGSTIKMGAKEGTMDSAKPVFERIYICFAAFKQGFKHCHPIIGLYGCHLKTMVKGVLLTACGIDANNNIFPIAYAVVEKEDYDNWLWFLVLLKEDCDIVNDYGYTFISDKQKGLMKGLEEVSPNSEHRHCYMHLYHNFRGAGHKGMTLRYKLWDICKATTEVEFKKCMKALKAVDPKACSWLDDKDPHNYSRAYFNITAKSDMLVNNCCEVFNGKILKPREMPIIGLLEGIREYLMKRFQRNRERPVKWHSKVICPAIESHLEELKVDSKDCIAKYAGLGKYQVEVVNGSTFTVNLTEGHCSCRKWSLTGIPCVHGICAMFSNRENPIDYVSDWYKVETHKMIYAGLISPMTSMDQWPETQLPPMLPPEYSAPGGRPKKLRSKSYGEEGTIMGHKLTRKGIKIRCKRCGERGHTLRKCTIKEADKGQMPFGTAIVNEETGTRKTHLTAVVPPKPRRRTVFNSKRKIAEALSTQQSNVTGPAPTPSSQQSVKPSGSKKFRSLKEMNGPTPSTGIATKTKPHAGDRKGKGKA